MAAQDTTPTVLPPSPATASPQQYLRACQLLVYGTNLNGLDLSNLRIKFSVKQTDSQSPNTADIRVYNVSNETALSMLINLNPPPGISLSTPGKVILQAGYQSNFGVIFQGNIKQIILGRETATDTYVDIVAGDGHLAYNYAIVNTTLAAGSNQNTQLNAAANAMNPYGTGLGYISPLQAMQLPRAKTMYGNARNYLRAVAQNTNNTWSIQNEQITFIPKTSYKPGEAVVLTSKTGLIGTPNQTNEGVNVKCLLNPNIQVGGRINIAEATVQDFKINLTNVNSPANIAPPLTQDGTYYVLTLEQMGDTRGVEWYTSILGITQSISTNPINSVQTSYGP
jgi:hypothetical protein